MNYQSLKTIFQRHRSYFLILAFFIAWLLVLYLTAFFTIDKNRYQMIAPWFSPTYWARWDSIYYVNIATQGYTELTSVFFPLYPLLIRFFYQLGANPFWAGHIISTLFCLASLILLYKIIKLEFQNHIALWTVGFLLIFPTSFFLISIYPTSLLLFLLLAAFYAGRKEKWRLAVFFGFLAASTKLEGLLILPLLFLVYLERKKFKMKNIKPNVFLLTLIPFGTLAYVFYLQQKFHRPFLFLSEHSKFFFFFHWPLDTITLYIQRLNLAYSTEDQRVFLVLAVNFLLFFMAAFLLASNRKKIRPSYFIFVLFYLISLLFADNYLCFQRLIITAFPIFLFFPLIKNTLYRILLAAIFCFLLIIFTSFFVNWHWVA